MPDVWRFIRAILLLGLLLSMTIGLAILQLNMAPIVVELPALNWAGRVPEISLIQHRVDLWVVLLTSFLIGVAVVLVPGALRWSVVRRRERRFIRELERELLALRSMPVRDEGIWQGLDLNTDVDEAEAEAEAQSSAAPADPPVADPVEDQTAPEPVDESRP